MSLVLFSTLFIATLVSILAPESDATELVLAFGGVVAVALPALGIQAGQRAGFLGMNSYVFQFGGNVSDNVDAGDVAALTKMCRAIGYLWLVAKVSRSVANLIKTAGAPRLQFDTKMRLPGSIEPNDLFAGKAPTSYNPTAVSADTMLGALVSIDSDCTDVINNLDQKLVKAGNLVVAVTKGGTDLSNEMSSELRIPLGNAAGGEQVLWIGRANTTAQDGVYSAPFSSAVAFATMGESVPQVPVVIS